MTAISLRRPCILFSFAVLLAGVRMGGGVMKHIRH